jgi:TRAP-type uncharacterized transport system substrate-binding protein
MANDKDGEAYRILQRALAKAQRHRTIRRTIAMALVAALLGVGGKFLYELLPRTYNLTITGGDILSDRHYVARVLEDAGRKFGLALEIVPTHGSLQAMDMLSEGKLDVAIIQGGLDADMNGITHVATLEPQMIHFLVRPSIRDVGDMRGKVINMGSRSGGTRVVGRQVLQFSGLEEGIDYEEANYSSEQLVEMPTSQLPDVLVTVSMIPSTLADVMVKQHGFGVLEMPFPKSLALRRGWVDDTVIPAYAYSVSPAVPPRDITTIGVHTHIIARAGLPPHAVFALLSTLYSPSVATDLRMKLRETDATIPSGFPLAEGTEMFLARHEPVLSVGLYEKAKSAFGLVMSLLSGALVVLRWLRGDDKPAEEEG